MQSYPNVSNENLMHVLDHLPCLLAVVCSTGQIAWANQAFCDYFNVRSKAHVAKWKLVQLWKKKNKTTEFNEQTLEQAIELGKEIIDIVQVERRIEYILHIQPVANGKAIYSVALFLPVNQNYNGKIRPSANDFTAGESAVDTDTEEKIIFESDEMISLFERVLKVAPLDCTVFIQGESGVGKEVIARTIHSRSRRGSSPFVPISVPAIPAPLLESELFGYESGAFTGSRKGGKKGLFEMANHGTLFLDEIGDIAPETQVKLLRAMERKEVMRVGGAKPIGLDVRIIAATNQDLKQLVTDGLFREDLYYRLNVVPLYIKPLREREADIAPLCRHFVKLFNCQYGTGKKLSGGALRVLCKYHWPGNVRELKNVLERTVIFSDSEVIDAAEIRSVIGFQPAAATTASSYEHNSTLLDEYQSREKSRILEALTSAGGNKSKAAAMLGISRSKLYRKLRGL